VPLLIEPLAYSLDCILVMALYCFLFVFNMQYLRSQMPTILENSMCCLDFEKDI